MRGEACENKNNAEKWQSQTVCKVHHLPIVLTVITLLIMLEFRQKLVFVFPKKSQKGMLGVIWSNEERIKVVLESANLLECMSSIFCLKNLQTSRRYSKKIDQGSQTNFTPLEQLYFNWKASKRAFETISKEESKDGRLQSATGW